jgi:hypothetical protein
MEDLRVQDYSAESNLYPGCEIDAEYYEMFVSNQDNFKDDIQKKTRTKWRQLGSWEISEIQRKKESLLAYFS